MLHKVNFLGGLLKGSQGLEKGAGLDASKGMYRLQRGLWLHY